MEYPKISLSFNCLWGSLYFVCVAYLLYIFKNYQTSRKDLWNLYKLIFKIPYIFFYYIQSNWFSYFIFQLKQRSLARGISLSHMERGQSCLNLAPQSLICGYFCYILNVFHGYDLIRFQSYKNNIKLFGFYMN